MKNTLENPTHEEELNTLLEQIKAYPKLTKEQELDYLKKAKTGDYLARNQLIVSNLRIVVSIAKECQDQGLELPDLIQEGIFGLIRAIEKFDVNRGTCLSAYAIPCIYQKMCTAIKNKKITLKLPEEIYNQMKKTKKIKENLAQYLKRTQH